MSLAFTLSLIKDDPVETNILHQLKVRETSSDQVEDAGTILFSYEFASLAQFEAATYYWQLRIISNRLLAECLNLVGHIAKDQSRIEHLKAENARMAINVMMSYHFGVRSRATGCWALALGRVAVWAALNNVSHFRWGSRVLSNAKMRPWLVQRYIDLHGGRVDVYKSDMDESAELLIGGPLRGIVICGVRSYE
jgi:hypothetical protein